MPRGGTRKHPRVDALSSLLSLHTPLWVKGPKSKASQSSPDWQEGWLLCLFVCLCCGTTQRSWITHSYIHVQMTVDIMPLSRVFVGRRRTYRLMERWLFGLNNLHVVQHAGSLIERLCDFSLQQPYLFSGSVVPHLTAVVSLQCVWHAVWAVPSLPVAVTFC